MSEASKSCATSLATIEPATQIKPQRLQLAAICADHAAFQVRRVRAEIAVQDTQDRLGLSIG